MISKKLLSTSKKVSAERSSSKPLTKKQEQLDINGDGMIDSSDLKRLRQGEKATKKKRTASLDLALAGLPAYTETSSTYEVDYSKVLFRLLDLSPLKFFKIDTRVVLVKLAKIPSLSPLVRELVRLAAEKKDNQVHLLPLGVVNKSRNLGFMIESKSMLVRVRIDSMFNMAIIDFHPMSTSR